MDTEDTDFELPPKERLSNELAFDFWLREARDESGNRPRTCPQCGQSKATFLVANSFGPFLFTMISPKYLYEGVWVCGVCDYEFSWSIDNAEKMPPSETIFLECENIKNKI